jgi:hypothetical protein
VQSGALDPATAVRFGNVGSHPISWSTGQPLVGRVLDPASGAVVGGGFLAHRGTGKAIQLEPGDRDTVAVVFGTASYDPALGYALGPGRYLVQVEFEVRPSPRSGPRETTERVERRSVTVRPAALTIV